MPRPPVHLDRFSIAIKIRGLLPFQTNVMKRWQSFRKKHLNRGTGTICRKKVFQVKKLLIMLVRPILVKVSLLHDCTEEHNYGRTANPDDP